MHILDGPNELTAEWLTEALHAGGTIRDARVTSFTAQDIGVKGEGVTGQLARVTLAYDIADAGAPGTLIAKFASADPTMRATVHGFGMYEREIRFYREIADQIPLRTPCCYYSDWVADGPVVLLIEDLSPAASGRELGEDSLDHLALAATEIARFHAAWWADPRLNEMTWLLGHDAEVVRRHFAGVRERTKQFWESFLEIMGPRLSSEQASLCWRAVDNLPEVALLSRFGDPRTIIHNDTHPDNLFFATPEGGVPFAVVDWQMVGLGHGPHDLAKLLASVPERARRRGETDLIRLYHHTLVKNGVAGYSFDDCWRDYRLSLVHFLGQTTSFILNYPRYAGPHSKFTDVNLPRCLSAVVDTNAAELLPEG